MSFDAVGGYLPVHYVAAACPSGAPEALDILLKFSRCRPIHKMLFNDSRSSENKEEKYRYDITNMVSLEHLHFCMKFPFRFYSIKGHVLLTLFNQIGDDIISFYKLPLTALL